MMKLVRPAHVGQFIKIKYVEPSGGRVRVIEVCWVDFAPWVRWAALGY